MAFLMSFYSSTESTQENPKTTLYFRVKVRFQGQTNLHLEVMNALALGGLGVTTKKKKKAGNLKAFNMDYMLDTVLEFDVNDRE